MGTFVELLNFSNPIIIDSHFDKTFSKWPGGSETSIEPSSFAFEGPQLGFEVCK